jgi:excisionase family DNA binding protein
MIEAAHISPSAANGERTAPKRLSYTVAQAVAASGIGRTTLYGLMRSGQLPFVKLGNRTLVRGDDLEKLLVANLNTNCTRPGARS